MSYTPRPFNPTNPYINQVIEELNKANTNFDLLANVFVDRDVVRGMVRNSDNSDKVDGYHASQTPAPNTIPVAKETGKLDVGWLPFLFGVNQVDFTSSGTWTVPEGVNKIIVIACAGGGGGASGVIATDHTFDYDIEAIGVGGEAGQSTIQVLSVQSGETLHIIIGAGGSGGNGNNLLYEYDVENSSGGTTIYYVYGGYGGNGGNTTIVGSVSGTLLNLAGGRGGSAFLQFQVRLVPVGNGDVGTFMLGNTSIFGYDGYGSGGEGGRGHTSLSERNGRAGKQGFVRIIYFTGG